MAETNIPSPIDGSGKRMVLIAGPTASGKSSLAVHVAKSVGGVVVNADSMQIYKELRVLTARPTKAQEAEVPHRLYGAVSGQTRFSVGAWLTKAQSEIAEVWGAGQVPVVTGGTGLYFEALVNGLAAVPQIPAEIRAHWQAVREAGDTESLQAALQMRDPQMAARLGAGDPQRLVRALEVIDATGKSLAEWQDLKPELTIAAGADLTLLFVAPPRADIYAKANARVAAMVEEGALEEVEALVSLGFDHLSPVMKAIGVAELSAYLAGDLKLVDALETMRTNTRRYAKRQLTWGRGRMADWAHVADKNQALAALKAKGYDFGA